MTDYKDVLGILATVIGFIGYIPYFRDIFRGTTKPHAFSWFVWFVLTAIGFAAQLVEGAGSGAWVTGFAAVACFTVFVLALFKGKHEFPVFDWVALASAIAALFLWWFTNDPLLSVILITITDAIGYIPTFRKGFYKPWEETATMFAFSSIKFIPALFALESYSLTTWLYPASLVLMNGLFVGMLLVRRKQVRF